MVILKFLIVFFTVRFGVECPDEVPLEKVNTVPNYMGWQILAKKALRSV